MISETFSISPVNKDATLTSYLWERSEQQSEGAWWQPALRPAVIVCPGGAYCFLSDREAEPVAMQFYSEGFQVFILRYSLYEECRYPAPLEEASRAIWLIRSHAGEWGIDPDKIIIGGFSAGAHFSALIGTRWNEAGLTERLGIPENGNKPNGLILSYGKLEPVREPLSSTIAPDSLGYILRVYEPEADTILNVSKETPPSFIWHTVKDELVPVAESIGFALRCSEQKVPFELHIFSEGGHGLSLADDLSDYGTIHPVNAHSWITLCINWFRYLFEF